MTPARSPARRRELVDLAIWLALTGAGTAAVWFAARRVLHTDAAPFLGSYRALAGGWLAPAGLLALAVCLAAARGLPDRARPFGAVQGAAYLAALAWSLCLAAGGGLGHRLGDTGATNGHPLRYLQEFTGAHATAAAGHPPGPALLLWALRELGMASAPALAVAVTALGTAAVPLMLAAVRDSCGETAARRYAPLLVLAPWALFAAGSMDAVATAAGAAVAVAGTRASRAGRTGPRATGWAVLAGLALGLASMFSYAAPWLGLSVVLLYFARRRPFLNIATGAGALVVPVAAAAAGFSWLVGLFGAHAGFTHRPASALLWAPVSLLVLLLCCGPALPASLRRLRNTPGWPFLAGAGLAVTFSLLAEFARGGTETAWLPFFGWLTLAATAPDRQAGPPAPTPVVLTIVGAATALGLAAVLAPP